MGFLSDIFGGGGSPDPIVPRLSAEGTQLESSAFGPISFGLSGAGFFPGLNQSTLTEAVRGITSQVSDTRRQALRNLNRTVPREDVGIRDFILKQITSAGARQIENVRSGLRTQAAEDIPQARQLALAGVGGGVELGSQVSNISNVTGAFLQNAPGFGSEFGGQLGFALADLVARAESGGGGRSGLDVSAFNRPATPRVGGIQTNQIPGFIDAPGNNRNTALANFGRTFNNFNNLTT